MRRRQKLSFEMQMNLPNYLETLALNMDIPLGVFAAVYLVAKVLPEFIGVELSLSLTCWKNFEFEF